MLGLVGKGAREAVSVGRVHVAVVYGVCCVHLVVAAPDRIGMQRQLAEYVERHADVQLFAGDAERVRSLLDEEAVEEAVRVYFACVGERWDREWLEERVLQLVPGAA